MNMFPNKASIRSVIEYLTLLAIKKEKQVFPKDLMKILEIEFRDAWMPKAGTLHPLLKRLEEKELLRAVEERRVGSKVPYELTKKGQLALDETFEYFKRTTDFHDLILVYGAEQFENMRILDLIIEKMERTLLLIKNRQIEGFDPAVMERLLKLRGVIQAQLDAVEEKIKQCEEEDGFIEVKIK